MSKTCARCKIEKPKSEFHKRRNGLQPKCKPCCSIVAAAYRVSHRDELNQRSKQWCSDNRTKESENLRKRSERYTRMGTSIEEYEAKFKEQKGFCLICGTHQDQVSNALHYDHCHETGNVRGLLCSSCNQKLGWFEKNKEQIMCYLASYQK